MREIKKINCESISEYMHIYLHAYPAFKTLDDAFRERAQAKVLRDMEEGDDVDFFGMFEDGRLIATMKLVYFQMNIYGRMTPAVGLMALAIHPLEKKRGCALEMVRFFEDYARDKGISITLLLPFAFPFYRQMGYGYGSKLDEYHIPTTSLPSIKDRSGLRFLSRQELGTLIDCHSRFAEKTHGMLKKFGEEIRIMEEDDTTFYIGCFKGDVLAGYIAYSFKEASEVNYTKNQLLVTEMIYEDGQVLRSLLGYLRLQADEAQTVIIRSGEEDFYHLLLDPADVSENYIPYGYLQTNVSAVGNMYKVLDPASFVASSDHRAFPTGEAKICFQYHDELENLDRSFLLTISGGKWRGEEALDDDALLITCKRADLSALLLGSARLASLVRLGVMACSGSMEELTKADALLYCSSRPFSNSDF